MRGWEIKRNKVLEVVHLPRRKNNLLIFKAVRIIEREYMWAISEEEVASFLKITPQYFSYLFHSVLDYSFAFYCNAYRINKSIPLLLSTEESIKDIAHKVGFQSESYYIKLFKRLSGITPGEYRRINLENKSR